MQVHAILQAAGRNPNSKFFFFFLGYKIKVFSRGEQCIFIWKQIEKIPMNEIKKELKSIENLYLSAEVLIFRTFLICL